VVNGPSQGPNSADGVTLEALGLKH
jgi:hypothetical protein